MTIAEIEKWRVKLADLISENQTLEGEFVHLSALKCQLTQRSLDMADARVVVDSIQKSLLARSDIRMAVTDKSSKFHELEQEFKSAVESQYIMRDELGRLRQDVLATEQRLQQSKEGQDNLLSILSKLKLKAETHKIRATGAETLLLNTKRDIAEQNRQLEREQREAVTEVDRLVCKREMSNKECMLLPTHLKEDIESLKGLILKQSSYLESIA